MAIIPLTSIRSVHRFLVAFQIRIRGESCLTLFAVETDVVLRGNMSGHCRFRIEHLVAVRTGESVVARVMEHVILQLRPLDEGHATLVAFIRFLARVCLSVAIQRFLCSEFQVALRRDE